MPVARILWHGRKVHVDESNLTGVDLLAQGGVALIRRTERDRLRFGQITIKRLPGGGASQHPNLERATGFVLTARLFRQRGGDGLRGTSCREATEADALAVLDEFRSFLCGDYGERMRHDPVRLLVNGCSRIASSTKLGEQLNPPNTDHETLSAKDGG